MMIEHDGNMDKKETDYPSIGKRIDINDIESCERCTEIKNSNKINVEEDDPRPIYKNRLQCPHYFDHLSKLSHGEMRKQFEATLGKHFEELPTLMQDTMVFINIPVNNERSIATKPDWFDKDKFIKGQAFARDNLVGIFVGQLYGLFFLICHEDGLKTLTMTKKSHTPYLAFNRYLSTLERIRNWYTEDPWRDGTKANKDIHAVRRMHDAVRRKLCELDRDEIEKISTIKNPYCPAISVIRKDLCTSLSPDTMEHFLYTEILTFPGKPKDFNQVDMSYTLFGFMGMVVLFPNEIGIYPKNDELENFCHFWKSIGYLLGIDDDANFCRGSVEDVKQRGHEYLELMVKPALQHVTPGWEHMSRCILEGFSYILPPIKFSVVILRIADLLNIEMPGLYASLTYMEWIQYKFFKYLIQWGLSFAIIRNFCNNVLNNILDKALNINKTKRAEIEEKSRNSMLHVA